MGTEYSARFLDAYNEIDDFLRHRLGRDRHASFSSLVTEAEASFGLIRSQSRQLKKLADLRNAIVHESTADREVIADPHPETVERIERIRDLLLRPPTLDQFQVEVHTCSPETSVREAAVTMLRGDFSQLPVYREGEFVQLLTAETIARWLASRLTEQGGVLDEEAVREVLEHTEDSDNCVLLARSEPVTAALDRFHQYSERGRFLDAVVITHSGRRSEQPVGILTVFDIPEILRMLE